ncbi:MAG TPA: biotin/lipoyl-containing protein [archaeon]|nr:biotin/lipoyl-containing protein [archaeon]
MKSFRIQVNDESYTVSLEQSGRGRYQATLDGIIFDAEITSNGDITSWRVSNGSEDVHAKAMNLPNDRVDVWLACMPFPATVQTVGIGGYHVPTESRAKSVGGEIRALMPGRITSILVKEEEDVIEGAPLLILEAMKMQNEITSPSNGKVKTIFVHEGETVKKDSVLVSIE